MFDVTLFDNSFNFRNHLFDLMDSFTFDDAFGFPKGKGFEKTADGTYVLSINVGKNVDNSKVKVHVDEDKYVSVVYASRTSNSTEMFSLKETLPANADAETLNAELNDGVLLVKVKPIVPKVENKAKSIPIEVHRNGRKTDLCKKA